VALPCEKKMVMWLVVFTREKDKQLDRFLAKNQPSKRKLLFFVVASCQKLGAILEIKELKNLSCQKMSITKDVLLK
jgi:hypothetical protein